MNLPFIIFRRSSRRYRHLVRPEGRDGHYCPFGASSSAQGQIWAVVWAGASVRLSAVVWAAASAGASALAWVLAWAPDRQWWLSLPLVPGPGSA
jgi:hypothetical protein